MKRFLLVMLVLLIGSGMHLFAGGGRDSRAGTSAAKTMTMIQLGYNDEQIQVARSGASGLSKLDQYAVANRQVLERQYPEVKFEWVDWGWSEVLDARQRAAIAAGTPPTNVSGEAVFPAYAEAGMLQEVPAFVLEGLNPTFIQRGKDGKAYGVAYRTAPFMLFYNKT